MFLVWWLDETNSSHWPEPEFKFDLICGREELNKISRDVKYEMDLVLSWELNGCLVCQKQTVLHRHRQTCKKKETNVSLFKEEWLAWFYGMSVMWSFSSSNLWPYLFMCQYGGSSNESRWCYFHVHGWFIYTSSMGGGRADVTPGSSDIRSEWSWGLGGYAGPTYATAPRTRSRSMIYGSNGSLLIMGCGSRTHWMGRDIEISDDAMRFQTYRWDNAVQPWDPGARHNGVSNLQMGQCSPTLRSKQEQEQVRLDDLINESKLCGKISKCQMVQWSFKFSKWDRDNAALCRVKKTAEWGHTYQLHSVMSLQFICPPLRLRWCMLFLSLYS